MQPPFVFIVGNSRSGTTMLMRMLNEHSEVHALNEWHFFEQLWSPSDDSKMTRSKAVDLASRLLTIQRDGYRAGHQSIQYQEEGREIINSIEGEFTLPINVYNSTAHYETKLNHKLYPCEKTPQNVFYIEEILRLVPGAKVLNIIRDPRNVLLSQKKKSNRGNLGAKWISKKESFRLRMNYHPITTSRLWNSSILASQQFESHSHVATSYFENIVSNPEHEMMKICQFLGINYQENMLNITHMGSSVEPDDNSKKGIKSHRTGSWEKDGLGKTEIYICQKISGQLMQAHGYEMQKITPNYIKLIYYYFSFPTKLLSAFLLNINRMKNIRETLQKRLKMYLGSPKNLRSSQL